MRYISEKIKSVLIPAISLIIFAIITIPIMINHFPYFDEAHAWMLAKFMNFSNFVDIIKMEGHPIGWFLVLIPFAKTDFYYPYSMLIINWLFWFSALLLMWIKAPFSNILKIIVTFSSVSLIYFSMASRGYSLGLLIIFILASLYKNQLKHPIIYSLLIAIAFHINIFIGIIASAFGFIFIYKLVKQNTTRKALPIIIIAISAFIFVLPFLSGFGDEASRHFGSPTFKNITYFFFKANYGFWGITYLGLLVYLYKKLDIIPKLFFSYIIILNLLIFGFLYRGFAHHFVLFFIYPILAIWISEKQEIWSKYEPIYFLIALIMFWPLNNQLHYFLKFKQSDIKPFINLINSNKELQGKNLYVETDFYSLLPYIKNNINLYEFCHLKKVDWKTNLYCGRKVWKKEDLFKNDNEFYFLTKYIVDDARPVVEYNGLSVYLIENK